MKHTSILAILAVASVVGATSHAATPTPTPTPAPNSISLTIPSDQAFTTSALPVTATATSGTPTIVVSGNASYSKTKGITLSGTGVITVTASEASAPKGYVLPDPVTKSFTVSKANQTIADFAPIAAGTWAGDKTKTIKLVAPAATSKLAVTLSVVSGPGTISGTTLTPTGAGSITIAADQSGNDNYNAAGRVTTTVVVNPGANKLSAFAKPVPAKPAYGATFSIPVPKGLASTPVVITATGATVSSDGTTATFTPTADGNVVITANQDADANWVAATPVTTTVVVAPQTTVITPAANQNVTFSPTVAPVTVTPTSTSSGAFTFSAKGPGTVNPSTGVVTITGAGSVVVSATQAASGDGNFAAVTKPVVVSTITVAKGTQTITPPNIPTPSTGAANGYSFNLPALNSDQGVACTYAATGSATVSKLKVTVTGTGTFAITASAPSNANYNALVGPVNIAAFTVTQSGSNYNFSKQ